MQLQPTSLSRLGGTNGNFASPPTPPAPDPAEVADGYTPGIVLEGLPEVPRTFPGMSIEQLSADLDAQWKAKVPDPRCTVGILCERDWVPATEHDPVLQIADAVSDQGGLPKLLFIGEPVEKQMAGIDAMAIPGGRDVDPSFYGEKLGPQMDPNEPDKAWDAFEIACIQNAFASGLPMLGHCRGEQIMNVAAGGTLYQDIPTDFTSPEGWGSSYGTRVQHRPEPVRTNDALRVDPVHYLVIEEGSRLHGIVGDSLESVNSIHHQAIKDVGPLLTPVAWAPDGLVEGVERKGMPWQAAYQFHPEALRYSDGAYNKVYAQLVDDGARFKAGELHPPAETRA